MIERRITFLAGSEGIPSWAMSRIKTLAGYFRSILVMHNVTRHQQADLSHVIRLMSLGTKAEDLCQLCIEGMDAELACMVLTDFLAVHFTLINTDHRLPIKGAINVDDQYPAFTLPFPIKLMAITKSEIAEKSALLRFQAQLLSQAQSKILEEQNEHFQTILPLLEKREQISATGMGHHIALPHAMSECLNHPAIAIVTTQKPIEWHSASGRITTSIAMVLPSPPERQHIIALSTLSKALLIPSFSQAIAANSQPEALRAIVLNCMNHGLQVSTKHD